MKKKTVILTAILVIVLLLGVPVSTTSFAEEVEPTAPTPIVTTTDSHGEGGW
ncbi:MULTISPECIES: hypothetical protein [Paenibacillus]|uniref:hypothetical protein n=1 Tax=Paenibacillus TaxID=44249 RepID=UPI001FFF987B|nr:hypothetical protein [Paenibacillus pabuli]UPK43481.1 hypothetical protein KET34_31205 [Paenibacillus pabuli]